MYIESFYSLEPFDFHILYILAFNNVTVSKWHIVKLKIALKILRY
jgi:hypothetical protein